MYRGDGSCRCRSGAVPGRSGRGHGGSGQGSGGLRCTPAGNPSAPSHLDVSDEEKRAGRRCPVTAPGRWPCYEVGRRKEAADQVLLRLQPILAGVNRRGGKRRRRGSASKAATSDESSTARSALRPAQRCRMDRTQGSDGTHGPFPGGQLPPGQYPSAANYPGAPNFPPSATLGQQLQGPWNPFLFYQANAPWFNQGTQHLPPNPAMMHPGTSGPEVVVPVDDADEEAQEEEVEVLEQPAVGETSDCKGKGTRKKVLTSRTKLSNFCPAKDVNLVRSWLEISCDPIIGTGQKKDRLWERIMDRYNTRRAYNPVRTIRSLQSRWDTIKSEVSKFAGFYADAIRANPSGMTDADKTTMAAATFAAVLDHNFGFLHCWELMKDEPKWSEPKTASKAQPASTGGSGQQPINLGDGQATPSAAAEHRPPGRDSSKAAKRRSGSDAGSTSSSEYAAKMQDLSIERMSMMQASEERKANRFDKMASIDEKRYEEMRIHSAAVMELEQEKLRLTREKQQMEKEKEDERILAVDLDTCTPGLRLYYQALQEEILERVAARRRKRQDP